MIEIQELILRIFYKNSSTAILNTLPMIKNFVNSNIFSALLTGRT